MRVGRLAAVAVALGLLVAPGCRKGGGGAATGATDPLGEARSLVEQGRFDEAIARAGGIPGAEAQFVLGRAWAGKARAAPAPTPAPGSSPAAMRLKPEEARALECFERAIEERPDHAAAHLAVAELLAPHALAGAAAGGAEADAVVERVLRAGGDAAQADPAGTQALETLVRVAAGAGRLGEADAAFQELTRRRREDADLLVRYGDFLAGPRRDAEAALAPYGQALIWRPGDAATRVKVARIHLAAAAALLAQRQYAAAEARAREARRLGLDPASPEGIRLSGLEAQLREIRGR